VGLGCTLAGFYGYYEVHRLCRLRSGSDCALAEGKSSASQYNIAFVPLNFVDMFKDAQKQGTTIIGLRNVLSADEVKEKLKQADFVPKAD
jgi:PTS system ascorbate-specific IIB component